MGNWLLLSGAIVAEVCGTLFLKASEGFSRLGPSLGVACAYLVAFVLLAQVLKNGVPVGTAYAIWSSLGVALIAIAGRVIFNEPLVLQSVLGIALIIVGVVLVETAH